MRICPRCRTNYVEPDLRICPRDGTRLRDAREFAAWEADPLRGALIAGRYRIDERIGSGGMGAVYRATQVGLDRAVAIKILKNELVSDPETIARFEREAKAMSLLTHPNTVRVFDFGETKGGLLYLAMELLEGDLLTSRLDGPAPVPLREAILIVRQMLSSLAEAHQKSIVHRDLKPDNVYLAHVQGRSEPVVKVLDFGIAKIVQRDRQINQVETQAGTVFGTPRYMSPEQAQGKPLDGRSDLYSVGVILYQLVVGKAPFLDDDAVVVMARHIKEVPQAPRKAAPERGIPEKLERIIMRALEKDPDARYENADAFDAALTEAFMELDPSGSARHSLLPTPMGVPVQLTEGGAARKALWIGAAVLLLAAAGAAFFAWGGGKPQPRVQVATGTRPPTEPAAIAPPIEHRTRIETTPSGAEVCLETGCIGRTPVDVTLPAGVASVRAKISLTGYEEATLDVPPSNTPLRISLFPSTAPVQAQTETRDAGSHHRSNSGGTSSESTTTSSQSPPTTEPAHATEPTRNTHSSDDDPYERLE